MGKSERSALAHACLGSPGADSSCKICGVLPSFRSLKRLRFQFLFFSLCPSLPSARGETRRFRGYFS